jgi:hypothetical protein
MSKKWIVAIVVCTIVCIIACAGMGVLRWGEMIYRQSDGQRGWSVGVAVYQLLGWDAEAYEEDFGQLHRLTVDDVDGETSADCVEIDASVGHHRELLRGYHLDGRFGRHGGPRFLAGLACVGFLGLMVVPAVFVYRRWRGTRDGTAAPAKSPNSDNTD